MDRNLEAVVGAALHDLSNSFAGIQGILDLSDPLKPLAPAQRERLDALLADGFTLLQRTRHLFKGTRPEVLLEDGAAWRKSFAAQAQSMVVAFRTEISVRHQGDPKDDRWPGELLRSWALAVTRQTLPFFRPTPECPGLLIESEADSQEWRLSWHPIVDLPSCLKANDELSRDISALWAREIGRSLGVETALVQGRIEARIPRF